MQIASTRKVCTCRKCESSKENDISNSKLNNEKCQNSQPARHKNFARSRQSKLKIRYTYGNHHRLDHTYAAAVNFNDVLQPKVSKQSQLLKSTEANSPNLLLRTPEAHFTKEEPQIVLLETDQELFSNGIESKSTEALVLNSVKEESDDISLKSTWLRNLCLEYQPPKKLSKLQDNSPKDKDAFREKSMRFHFSDSNGTLKQYQRNRKVNKLKTENSTTCFGKSKNVKSVQEDKKRWIAALALVELAQSK